MMKVDATNIQIPLFEEVFGLAKTPSKKEVLA